MVGWFARFRILAISHETIYRHIWRDQQRGGTLHVHPRRANKPFRKRYGAYDSRGRRAGAEVNARLQRLIEAQPRSVRTITVDNGTECHSYKALEERVAARFDFATPHHAWARGTNENTNGLIRQYLPKGASMEHLRQRDCQRIGTAAPGSASASAPPRSAMSRDAQCCTSNLTSGGNLLLRRLTAPVYQLFVEGEGRRSARLKAPARTPALRATQMTLGVHAHCSPRVVSRE